MRLIFSYVLVRCESYGGGPRSFQHPGLVSWKTIFHEPGFGVGEWLCIDGLTQYTSLFVQSLSFSKIILRFILVVARINKALLFIAQFNIFHCMNVLQVVYLFACG